MPLTTIILTLNEERHIGRAIASIQAISNRILVVDSGSSDRTLEIALSCGAEVLTHGFVNQADQFNWALRQLPADTGWVLRLDADEFIDAKLAEALATRLPLVPEPIDGILVSRRIAFLGRPIRHGGVFPVRVLRLFRHGRGRSEDRWMDEHILVEGGITSFPGEILDDNLNSLTWWTQKHNAYASREAVELLNLEFGFLSRAERSKFQHGGQAGAKRWLKERVYAHLPAGFRALCYFLYRYLLRFGFLDGREGTAFHVLQGFWYRYLVDLKLHEVRTFMRRTGAAPEEAVETVLGICLR